MDFFRFFQKETSYQKNENDIGNDQIRFVVYQNSSTILFDTLQIDAVKYKRNTVSNGSGTTSGSNGPSPANRNTVPSSNAKSNTNIPQQRTGKIEMLREMMFGTVPLNIQGTTTKLHYLPDNQQLLLTKLFTLNLKKDDPPSPPSLSSSSSSTNTTSQNDNHTTKNRSGSSGKTPTTTTSSASNSTTNLPSIQTTTNNSATTGIKDDKKASSSTNGEVATTPSSASTTTTTTTTTTNTTNNDTQSGSLSSSTTSIGTPSKDGVNRARSSSTLGNRTPRSPLSLQPKITKVTVSICVIFGPSSSSQIEKSVTSSESGGNIPPQSIESVSNFHQFIITHFLLIDTRIKFLVKLLKNQLYSKFTQLLPSTKASGASLSTFGVAEINRFYTQVEKFRQYIKDFYIAPRLEKPIWLDSLAYPSTKRQSYIILLEQLRELLPVYNTPKSKFFLSNLITSVLSYNMSWLSNTLATGPNSSLRCKSDRCNSIQNFQNQFLEQISEIYGYNGCISPECKNNKSQFHLSKAIIISPKEDLSKKFLQVISFFWRTFELIVNKNFLDFQTNLYNQEEINVNFLQQQQQQQNGKEEHHTNGNQQHHYQQHHQAQHLPHHHPHHHFHHHHNQKPLPSQQPPSHLLKNHINESLLSSNMSQSTQFKIGSQNVNLPSRFFNLSRSLMGSYQSKYISDFAIMALPRDDFYPILIEDLRLWLDHHPFVSPIKESISIVADLSKCKCDIIVCSKENVWNTSNPVILNGEKYTDIKIIPGTHSEYISSALSSIVYFWTIGMPPESCIIYLEDKLRELFDRTILLTESVNYYSSIKQNIPQNFNVFTSTTSASNIPLPVSMITPIATPSHSPHSSQNYSTYGKPQQQKQQQDLQQQMTGDQILLDRIHTYLTNCLGNNECEIDQSRNSNGNVSNNTSPPIINLQD
eukprot:gene5998-7472_t